MPFSAHMSQGSSWGIHSGLEELPDTVEHFATPDGEKAFKEHQSKGKKTASEALYSTELPMAQ